MDALINMIMGQIMANPAIMQMAIGTGVSLLVAQLKAKFPAVDAAAKDPAQVKWVQLLVMALSLAGTLGTAYLTNNLHGIDTASVTAFLTTLATAVFVHDAGTSVKKQIDVAKK